MTTSGISSRYGKIIHVQGTVQGVGFRPAIWRLASGYGLIGCVWNEGDRVGIRVWGAAATLDEFIRQLPLQAPPRAKITEIQICTLHEPADCSEFSIIDSKTNAVPVFIPADLATCPSCLKEIFDPTDRRYNYPFTNCTDCGPRFSIMRSMPYDRSNTAMSHFEQCPACLSEYTAPSNRRFHAQTNGCQACGPKLWLEDSVGRCAAESHSDCIELTAELLRQGYIVAIKGIGGFHLACDATNQTAATTLRHRKQRGHKPFAVMMPSLDMLARYAKTSELERQLLNDVSAPIVIVNKAGETLATAVAPETDSLGCILPYTPLYHSLMRQLNVPIVLTSGNRHDEPQCISNADARKRLAGISDFWLFNDREIVNRLDDSVVRVIDRQPRIYRRARGITPHPIDLPNGFESVQRVLAMGGELKNTFCLLHEDKLILSPYIGDLENITAQHEYRHMLDAYQDLFNFRPQMIATDLHQNYLSTYLGQQLAMRHSIKQVGIQHHHAHIAACMVEHGLPIDCQPVLGIALDGLGLGDDRQLWGGEFLKVTYRQSVRVGAFQALPMLGAAQAVRQPWRNCYAHLKHYFDWQDLFTTYANVEIIRFLNEQRQHLFDRMLDQRINSPLTSSCGRWFDAFAAALGICRENAGFEGQAAIGLENMAAPAFEQQRGTGYSYESFVENGLQRLSWKPFWQEVLDDLQQEVEPAIIAAKIHHGLAQSLAETASSLRKRLGLDTVVLSGGVFQNRLLLEETSRLLRLDGTRVLSPSLLPCNDGGLSAGQAIIAAASTQTTNKAS